MENVIIETECENLFICPSNIALSGAEIELISKNKFDKDPKEFIKNFPEETIARQKSAEMLKLLLLISNKLRGTIKRRKINPWEDYGASHFTTYINNSDWLFTRSGELSHPTRMSRFDLNESIYRDLPNMKEAFEVIGFKKKEEDTKAETFERIEALDRRDKNTLLRQLARELGFEISPTGRTSGNEGEN